MNLYPDTAKVKPIALVMVKGPCAGNVKTRLRPLLTPKEAETLAGCFAQDAVAKTLSITDQVLIVYAPDDGRDTLAPLLPAGLLWTPQQGDNLGARMGAATQIASDQGFAPIVTIGIDSPTLPKNYLTQAFEILSSDSADIVLEPSYDGGYYLIGVQKPIRCLFDDVAWSTPYALRDTMRNAAALNLRVLLLPHWYDVDTPDDFQRLRSELRGSKTARERAPRTTEWFSADAEFRL